MGRIDRIGSDCTRINPANPGSGSKVKLDKTRNGSDHTPLGVIRQSGLSDTPDRGKEGEKVSRMARYVAVNRSWNGSLPEASHRGERGAHSFALHKIVETEILKGIQAIMESANG